MAIRSVPGSMAGPATRFVLFDGLLENYLTFVGSLPQGADGAAHDFGDEGALQVERLLAARSEWEWIPAIDDSPSFGWRGAPDVSVSGLPDLTAYKPLGWSDNIVVSTGTGGHTDSATLYSNQNLYVDWAVINSGTSDINSTFYTYLYVDGVYQTSWFTSFLQSTFYTSVDDFSLGTLSAGTHTVKIITDATGAISEASEGNNQYTKTITVTAPPVNADLTAYQPFGWSDKIVVSTGTGSRTDSATLYSNQNLYVDWAVINNGSGDINSTFYTYLYLDGVYQTSWYTSSLQSSFYISADDYSLGTLSVGTHTLKIITDATGVISETNEANNQYTKTITVTAPAANADLTAYQPFGWSDKIVVSTGTGGRTDSATLYSDQNLYVDWAVINNGSGDINSTFYTYLYLDGVYQTSWYSSSLSASYYTNVDDYSLGTLSAGTHTVKIVTDATGAISETNEGNNQYTKTITVTTRAVNHAPVVIAHDVSVVAGQSISASSAITSVNDQDGNSITQYAFWDAGTGGGYFTVNGSAQASVQWIYVDAANLGTVRYVGGSGAGAETLYISAYDGKDWSSNASFTATTSAAPINHAPIVTVHNASVAAGQSLAASSLISSVQDQDGDPIAQYGFWDSGNGGGYFTVNGIAQASGQWIDVTAANLGAVRYVGGGGSGFETLYIDAYDGKDWSANASLTATTTAAAVNHAPVVSVHDVSVAVGQSLAASSLISSVQDQDGDAVTQYGFWDGVSGGGYFTVNGIAQASGQWINVSAASIGTVRYVGGAGAGTETLYVEASDGKEWSAYVSLSATTTSSSNHAPVLTVHDVNVAAGQSTAASALISSVKDLDGDSITQYAFWDGGTGGGYFTVNGVAQGSGQWIYVDTASLGTVRYFGGAAASSEALYVDAYDGKDWSAITSLTATTTIGSGLPTISVRNQSVGANASILASSLISSVTDPANRPITFYDFRDNGIAGGHFVLAGVVQSSGVWITVSASDLPSLSYVGGTVAGSEALDVAVWDGLAWSDYQTATVTTTAASRPVVVVQGQTVDANASIQAASLIASYSDPNNQSITQYEFRDNGAGGGHLALNGVSQASGTFVIVSAADLSKLTYVGASTAGAESIDVAIFDNQAWSFTQTASVTTVVPNPPVVTVQSQVVAASVSFQASALITDVFDPNNFAISSYRFMDDGAGGGHFTLNGVTQASGAWITVSAADLSKVAYVGGAASGNETVDVQAYDGHAWSNTASATVITTANSGNPPVVTTQNQSVNQNNSILASSLIASISDPGGFPITFYQFRDNGTAGGHFIFNNFVQASGTWIVVSANDLPKLRYVGGSTPGSESVTVTVYDGHNVSGYKDVTVTTNGPQDNNPVIVVRSQSVDENAAIAASSLIVSVADPNNLAITAYDFRDNDAGGGHFSLNGVAQANGVWITVSAADLSKLTYVGGASVGSESVDIAASNGFGWSNYLTTIVTTKAPEGLPVLTVKDLSVDQNATLQAASLIGAVSDPNGYPITSYQFRDNGSGGGHFVLGGVTQASGTWISVSSANLSTLTYIGGATAGSETVDVAVWDGHNWSATKSATLTTNGSAVNPVLNLLHDAGIKADVSAGLGDNALSYTEMLKILQDAAASGVNATEFADLQTLVANFNKSNGITVSAYVYDLTNHLVNGNTANAQWTGGLATSVSLGNLGAGSSQDQMNKLIGKWFLGTDLPSMTSVDQYNNIFVAPATYNSDSNQLFGSSGQPDIHDIQQGQLGDCYFEASMMVVAQNDPSIIQSMFIKNDNGTYGVRFFINGKATYVTVNDQLPFYTNYPTYLYYNSSNHIWASLLEKAYVQLNAEGVTGQDIGNAYGNINGGLYEPLTQLTNKSVNGYWHSNYQTEGSWEGIKQTIINALQSHQEVLLASWGESTIGGKTGFVAGHMFGTLSYDTATGNFVVRNPWGDGASGSTTVQFEATMADLYNMNGDLYVAQGATGAAPGAAISGGSVAFVLNAFQNGSWTSPVAVNDSANAIQQNIDRLQDAASLVSSIALTDGGTATLAITAAQSIRDHGVLTAIQSSFALRITSTADSNQLMGATGDDWLTGGSGNDSLDGGAGVDTAIYSGNRSGYTITSSAAGYVVSDVQSIGGSDGTDTLAGIERVAFADGTITLHAPTGTVTIAGIASQGQTLTAANTLADADGIPASGAGALKYQWFANSLAIDGATGNTLLLGQAQVGKAITVTAAYIDNAGTVESVTSGATAAVGASVPGVTRTGTSGSDTLTGTVGDDTFNGGDGLDTVLYTHAHTDYVIHHTSTGFIVAGRDGVDTMAGIERLTFSDVKVALDVAGNAGQAYRLYQAAFDRTPDIGGLGYQMNALDHGRTLAQVAGDFLLSPEFQTKYGNVSDATFVSLLYQNVLHRTAAQDEIDFHVNNELHAGYSRAQELTFFSESPENQTNVIGAIQDGMVFTV